MTTHGVFLSNTRQLLPNIDSSHIKSRNVSILYLRMYLTIAADREDDITIARIFILFMIGHLWFQTANDTVSFGFFVAVANLDVAAQYDWGSAILASLYHSLDTAVTTGGAIIKFSQLLEYWFYEYYGVGHPIVKENIRFSAYLYLRAWERGNKKKTNDQMMPLRVPNGNCKYYLGDRCWKQLTGETRIPLDPPLSLLPHISPVALQEIRQARFLDCEQFVIGEERETYASYWAEQTLEVGPLLTDSQRMGNIDLFGPSTLRAKSSWDTQRLQQLTDELATAHRHIDSINDQLYAHDLQLRRGLDVLVMPLPPGGGTRTRHHESGL
ncbi:hypothetical protein GIB67_019443 [Kingdonia uniflora]|uniref:Aminotransferase-like plant mobile domain-containing protein n=1 Tax=Kingdonia uniflora TaxID=39325 RepID=A0A7J7MU92_9MAGN|nr:hypothetical protein GIB67_019443 [Kingdonia uniflora]